MLKRLLFFQALVLSLNIAFAQQAVELFPNLVVKGEPEISAIAQASDGGYFLATRIDRINGVKTSCLSKIDESGNPVEGFAQVFLNNRVYHMEEVAGGKILIAGTFTKVNGLDKSGLVQFNADGTIDETFTALGTGSATDATSFGVQQDGKIIVSGDFSKGGYTDIARLNTNGTIDNTFSAFPPHDQPIQGIRVDANDNIYINGYSKIFKTNSEGVQLSGFPIEAPSNSAFYGIHLYGNKLLVRGYFSSIGGQTRSKLAIINEDGSIDPFNTSSSSSEGKAVVKSDGTIILDQETATLVINANGTIGSYLTSGFTGPMLVDSEQRLIVAGSYDFKVNGVAKPYLIRFNNDFSLDNTFQCQVSFTAGIKAIAVYPDGRMLIGGDRGVKGIGNTSNRLARLLADGTIDETFNPVLADDGITAIALQGDNILVCAKSSLRRLTSTGAVDNSFQQKSVTNWDQFTNVKVYNSKIYLSGAFTTVNGTSSPGIIRLNADGTVDPTFSSPFTSAYVMNFIFQSSGKIIVVGPMNTGSFQADLTRLNINGSIDNSFNSGSKSGNGIYALAVDSQDNIYFAGDFTGYDNTVNRFGKLSADGDLDTSFKPSWPFEYNDRITTMQVLNDDEIMVGVDYFPYNMYRASWTSKVMAVVNSVGTVVTLPWDDLGFNASVPASFFDGTRLYIAGRIVSTDDNGVFSPIAIINVNFVSGNITELAATRPSLTQVSLTWESNLAKAEQLIIERSVGDDDSFSQLAIVAANQTAYIDNTEIEASQAYYYRIKATNAISETAYSNIASAMPVLIVNAASEVDTASFKVSWNLLSSASGYKVELTDNNFASILATEATTTNLVTFNELEAYHAYKVRVSYLYDGNYQPAQNIISVTTQPLAPVITAITVPSRNIISFDWTNRFPQATQIKILRSLNAGSGFSEIASVAGTADSYTDAELQEGNVYYYRIQATLNSVSTGYSNTVSETTELVSFEIQDIDTASFRVVWAEVASAEEYKVEISTDDFATAETIFTNETNVLIDNLEAFTVYSVRISFLYNGAYHTSDVVSATTLPHAPLLIQAEALSRRIIDLSWINQFNEATQISIYRSSSVDGVYEQIATVPGNADVYRDSTLYGGNVYYYKIKASSLTIETPFSNIVSDTTDPRLPQTVTFDLLPELVYSDTTIELTASASSGLEVVFLSEYRSIATVDGNVLQVVGTGDGTITAFQAGNQDYESASQARQLRILKAPQTVSFDLSPTMVFSPDAAISFVATASSGQSVSFESDNDEVIMIVDNAGIIKGAGTVTITAIQAGGRNYHSAQQARTINITKADQQIEFIILADTLTMDDEAIELDAIATSGLAVTFTSSDSTIISVTGNQATLLKTGTVTITATQDGDTNYNSTQETRIVTILKGEQSINFLTLSETYSLAHGEISLEATATSGLTVTFESSDPAIVSVVGKTAFVHDLGTVTLTAKQNGNENFHAATEVTQVIEIVANVQSITFELSAKTFGDAPFELMAVASSGLPVTYSSANANIATIVGSMLTIHAAGTVAITARQEGSEIFDPVEKTVSLVIAKATQTIDFALIEEIDILNKLGDMLILEATSSSGLPVTYTSSNPSIAQVIEGDQLKIFHPGNVIITASQAGDLNHNAATSIERLLKVRLITGSEEIPKTMIEVFPNPSVQFNITARECFTDYVVVSANGIVVDVGRINGEKLYIDLSGEAPGIYHLLVNGCAERLTFELVRQ